MRNSCCHHLAQRQWTLENLVADRTTDPLSVWLLRFSFHGSSLRNYSFLKWGPRIRIGTRYNIPSFDVVIFSNPSYLELP